ncbi:glycosyltransferase family 2 protein [Polaribacter sp. SA4-12]|uniref:glycosyltransferase family 2 protein n=1 Tax=Polaribacter sp. SA4-12 TaxID=1312072 RepID=UPI000B3C6F0C|nr:glycosyltransferase family 2 protein [Polaribacter sp. SA4-12]ARV15113.1 hypothetical protein BTO07_08095 [Polaribacter sp. SA4-12]
MKPLLSIIVPIYNVEKYLKECLDSILKQPFDDYELILINDGSTDNCSEICDSYAIMDKRIKVIHKPNGGLSEARNFGIDNATGKYLSFIDSDDFISKDFYKNNVDYLQSNEDVDFLVCQYCKFDGINNNVTKNVPLKIDNKKEIFEYIFSDKYICSAWINIYKREVFKSIRFPKGKIFEDGYILPDIIKVIKNIYLSNEGIYYYRVREDSIMKSTRDIKKWQDVLDAYRRMLDYIELNDKTSLIFLNKYCHYSIGLLNAINQHSYKPFQECITHFQSYKYSTLSISKIDVPILSKFRLILLKIFGFRLVSLLYKLVNR